MDDRSAYHFDAWEFLHYDCGILYRLIMCDPSLSKHRTHRAESCVLGFWRLLGEEHIPIDDAKLEA
jgi:hypothetical protein